MENDKNDLGDVSYDFRMSFLWLSWELYYRLINGMMAWYCMVLGEVNLDVIADISTRSNANVNANVNGQ